MENRQFAELVEAVQLLVERVELLVRVVTLLNERVKRIESIVYEQLDTQEFEG